MCSGRSAIAGYHSHPSALWLGNLAWSCPKKKIMLIPLRAKDLVAIRAGVEFWVWCTVPTFVWFRNTFKDMHEERKWQQRMKRYRWWLPQPFGMSTGELFWETVKQPMTSKSGVATVSNDKLLVATKYAKTWRHKQLIAGILNWSFGNDLQWGRQIIFHTGPYYFFLNAIKLMACHAFFVKGANKHTSAVPKHTPRSSFSCRPISQVYVVSLSHWSSHLEINITPFKLHLSPKRDYSNRKYIDSNHWFQGLFVRNLWYRNFFRITKNFHIPQIKK